MKIVFYCLALCVFLSVFISCKKDDSVSTDSEVSIIGEDGTFVDKRDNHRYMTVKIGTQIWMAENLAYLPEVSPPSEYSYSEKHYYVNEYEGSDVGEAKSTDNYNYYGVLYNWPAAIEACPPGWHLPSQKEWDQLAEFISNENGGYKKTRFNWEKVGDHLKSAGEFDEYDYWLLSLNSVPLDDYNFRGLPAGEMQLDSFYNPGAATSWWSATPNGYSYAWAASIGNENYLRIDDSSPRFDGYSVRCIKD